MGEFNGDSIDDLILEKAKTRRVSHMKQQRPSRLATRIAVILLSTCSGLSAEGQAPTGSDKAPVGQPADSGDNASAPGVPVAQSAVDLQPWFQEWGLSARAQGSRGTCSAFTVTRAIEYALARKRPRGPRLSVEFLNWASNEAIGQRRDGGFFSDLWKGFEKYGICREDEMPYAAAFDPGLRPSDATLAHARHFREAGLRLHWIKPWDPMRGLNDEQFAAAKETLRRGWPVCGGFLWPKQAEWVDGVLQMASRENVRDGHSVLLVGFRDDRAQPGGGVFLIQNTSSGPRHGAMSYEYVRTYMNDAAWIGFAEQASAP